MEMKMIEAPEGMLRWYESSKPPKQLICPIRMESQIICLKLWLKRLAVICGKVSREMTSTIPTMRRQATTVRAISIMSKYSIRLTGNRCERANSRSKAMATMDRSERVKKSTNAVVTPPINQRSLWVMVRMLPKR